MAYIPKIKEVVRMGKLKAALSAAKVANLYTRLPLIAPPAWVAGMTAYRGMIVSNGGNWYTCQQPGTAASSGSGPSGILGGNIADGSTVIWNYFGPATITSNDPTAPVVTQSSTNPGYGTNYNFHPNEARFTLYGCNPTLAGLSTNLLGFIYTTGGSRALAAGRAIETFNDGAQIVINLTGTQATSCFRIAVDQYDGNGFRFLQPGGFSPAAGVFTTLVFPVAKKRRFKVFFSIGNPDTFAGVQVDSNSTIWAPGNGDALTAVVISDSTVAGDGSTASGPVLPGNDVCSRLSETLGIKNVISFSTAGTGETVGATGYLQFIGRIPEALTYNPDLWLVIGSCNDYPTAAATLTAAVTATETAIRAGGSTAPIIRGGNFPITSNPNIVTAEQAILAGHNAFAATDPYPHGFVPYIYNASPPIINWTAGTDGATNLRYLTPDGHPSDWGTIHETDFLVEGIQRIYAAY